MLAQGVNAAANNGAKGDTAAALAQEAVDEFEAGQAVTAVGRHHHSLRHLLYQRR
jgi:Na+-transporting methylmalonyl-CoA/oxaloacetate decarboxylase gamma subunit